MSAYSSSNTDVSYGSRINPPIFRVLRWIGGDGIERLKLQTASSRIDGHYGLGAGVELGPVWEDVPTYEVDKLQFFGISGADPITDDQLA